MTTDPDPPRLRLVHRAGRRLRLRFERAPPEGAALTAMADRLAGIEGVVRARIRPGTGSVILDLASPAEEVLEALAASGIAQLESPRPPVPVGLAIADGLAQADARLARGTDGALDLRTALGVLLAVAAVLQLARGRVAGPATTLGLAAYSLLTRSGK